MGTSNKSNLSAIWNLKLEEFILLHAYKLSIYTTSTKSQEKRCEKELGVQLLSVIKIIQGATICYLCACKANYAAWGQAASSSGSLIELSCCHEWMIQIRWPLCGQWPTFIYTKNGNPTRASVMDVCVAVDGHLMDALNYLPPWVPPSMRLYIQRTTESRFAHTYICIFTHWWYRDCERGEHIKQQISVAVMATLYS